MLAVTVFRILINLMTGSDIFLSFFNKWKIGEISLFVLPHYTGKTMLEFTLSNSFVLPE